MRELTDEQAHKEYDAYLNELAPLEGINCNPFSTLLLMGDSIAYHCGFDDFLSMEEIELTD